MRLASSASPTDLSTIAGSIGRRRQNCWTKNAPITSRMYLREICGCPPHSTCERVRKNHKLVLHIYMGSGHLIERGASMFPAYLREEGDLGNGGQAGHRPNLSSAAQRYLKHLGATVEDLFYHLLATLHDPAYRKANAGALKMEWPRIPLPGWAQWRSRRRRRDARCISGKRPRTSPPARPRNTRAGRYPRHLAPRNRRPRRACYHRRPQHDRRRFRPHRRLGPLRNRRRRHAGSRPHRRNANTQRMNAPR